MSTMPERAREKADRFFDPPMRTHPREELAAAFTAFATSELERAKVPEMREALEEAAFLLARLEEWSNEHLTDSNARDWIGHIQPSIERLHIALLSPADGGKP